MKKIPLPVAANAARRKFLVSCVGVGALTLSQRAAATKEELASAIAAFAGGAPVASGRVVLDIASLVENGNSVPVTVTVESPMTSADRVVAIAIFNELNPQRDVVKFQLGPRAGRARVSTRIRLATSQKLTAVAQLADGSFWSQSVDVVVTLAACIEG